MIFEKISTYAYLLSKYLIMVLVGLMSIVIVVQVLCRTFLGFSIFWSEEFARYCLVWITFIGASMAIRNAELAKFDLLIGRISAKWRWVFQLVLDGFMLIFIVLAIYYGFKHTFAPTIMTQVSAALRAPMWIVFVSVPIGFILMFIYIIDSMVQTIMKRNEGVDEQ